MLRELLTVFRSDNPLHAMGGDIVRMLGRTEEMTTSAGCIYLGGTAAEQDRGRLYNYDVEVNKLERDIRKRIVAHLSIPGNSSDAAYCLLLMSLVKDIERIGDYAKNLAEIEDIRSEPMPDVPIVRELQGIRQAVDGSFRAVTETFSTSDHDRAEALIEQARGIAHQSDSLIERISHSDYDANLTAALVLGTRYYKRINGHLLNVLSSVVMPVHKIDYYDEVEIPKASERV